MWSTKISLSLYRLVSPLLPSGAVFGDEFLIVYSLYNNNNNSCLYIYMEKSLQHLHMIQCIFTVFRTGGLIDSQNSNRLGNQQDIIKSRKVKATIIITRGAAKPCIPGLHQWRRGPLDLVVSRKNISRQTISTHFLYLVSLHCSGKYGNSGKNLNRKAAGPLPPPPELRHL